MVQDLLCHLWKQKWKQEGNLLNEQLYCPWTDTVRHRGKQSTENIKRKQDTV